MNFPVWEMDLGNGLLIAIVAVSHVFVSHFAIGGGFFLTLTEYYAYKKRDSVLLKYVKMHSKFFALLTLVYGAITGVGIWFTIGLINPAATSALIHNFVWVWALEWVFFFTEVAAAVVYYNTWDKVSQTTHFIIGWIYFVSAFMSLVLINGILTFMLTPNVWLETKNIWEGFFNATFLPSLFTRTGICIMLAGIYALVTSSFFKEKTKRVPLIRYAGIWMLAGIIFLIPNYAWYHSNLPLELNELFAGGLPTPMNALYVLGIAGFALFVFALIPVLFPKYFHKSFGFVFLLAGLLVFGASEFIRESVRKPYVIYGYMYGNLLRPEEYPVIEEQGGLLASAIWVKIKDAEVSEEAGEEVFRVACRGCHSITGYKGLKKTMNGLNAEFITEVIKRLERLRGKMPPFPGNETERQALALYIKSITDPDYKITTGEEVFKKRCNICHTKEGEFRGLYPLLEGYSHDEILERIPTLGSMQEKMAPWSGTDEEAAMLAEYLNSWYNKDQ
ncbi:c-type cytochrome [candidate division KSB1 bacterium]